jgi:hypothetical protein
MTGIAPTKDIDETTLTHCIQLLQGDVAGQAHSLFISRCHRMRTCCCTNAAVKQRHYAQSAGRASDLRPCWYMQPEGAPW